MKDFWEQIQNFAQALNDNKSLLSRDIYPDDLTWQKPIEELVKVIKSGKCTLVAVRPDDEIFPEDKIYQKYVTHLSFENLKSDHLNFPKSKPILVFCRGRLCVLSCESTVLLRKKGFKAYKLDFSWHQLSDKLKETI
jgi:hypothetical protein